MTLTAGLGFRMEHLEEALTSDAPGLWFEVHAENYMVEGGPRLAALKRLSESRAISLHGVGLSLASTEPPCAQHLSRLASLMERIEPIAVSDHLAWQRWNGMHHADFLPFPRTRAALQYTVENVDRVQTRLRRRIMVENPSLYVDLPGHEMSEAEFLCELAASTGCGLLLDVNNAYVSAANLGFCAAAALQAIPAGLVGEIHLAGHSPDGDPASSMLIDSHGAPIDKAVWNLFEQLIERIGPRPTLIERDNDVPPFATLLAERDRAHKLLTERELTHA